MGLEMRLQLSSTRGVEMKTTLLTLFLMAATLLATGCAASVRYNRGYYRYGNGDGYRDGYRHDRDWNRDHLRRR